MKTKAQIFKFGFSVVVLFASLIACKKKDDDSAQTPTYQYINGICYNNQNQPVATQLCTTSNNGYYLVNGQCYHQSQPNIPQPTQYCQQGIGNNSGYYMMNGYCYHQNQPNVPQPNQYCQQGIGNNGGYYYSNGYCYGPQGQVVSNQYCQQGIGGGGIYGQQCFGSYIYQSGYWTHMIYCSGANCRGYTLIEAATNRSVTCQ